MPITQGSGNPDWTRDETILALNLLYRHDRALGRTHREVRELSELLRMAELFPIHLRKANFRNVDGVALKLQNLLSAINPNRGLSSSKKDRELVAEFPASRAQELAVIADAIQKAIERGVRAFDVNDDDVFVEGRLVTATHRERDSEGRRQLLSKQSTGPLICEICGFCPPNLTRPLQESFFEVHHLVPLSHSKGQVSTRLSDLSLLCASCHRFLHKLMIEEKKWLLPIDAKSRLRGDG